ELRDYRSAWEARGLPIVAMQALLFGRDDLLLFDAESRPRLAQYLARIIDVGAALGARALVFGSPKNRRRGALAPETALDIAATFFREMAVRADAAGAFICVEPNPPSYGCDFITTTDEAVGLAERVDH